MYKSEEHCQQGKGCTTSFDLHVCSPRVLESTQKRKYGCHFHFLCLCLCMYVYVYRYLTLSQKVLF